MLLEILTDTIPTAISNSALAISDVSKLITKALPGEEQQLQAFKLRSPKIYANIRQSLLNKFHKYCKKHFMNTRFLTTYGGKIARDSVKDYVTLQTGSLPPSEQELFIKVVLARLNYI